MVCISIRQQKILDRFERLPGPTLIRHLYATCAFKLVAKIIAGNRD